MRVVTFERFADGLVRINGQPWCRVKLRGECRCALTGRVMPKGTAAYSPLGNRMNRHERVAADEVDKWQRSSP